MCSCDDSMQYVSCENKSLSEVPHNLPSTVTSLDLSNNQIKDINSTNFFRLSSVETIDLSSNLISSIPEATFRWNHRLVHLILDDNQMQAIPGMSFGMHNSLTSLSLARNQINSIASEDLSRLQRLNVLNLSGNKLTFLPSFFFESLSELLALDLEGNDLFGLFNLSTRRQHNLAKLSLANNEISSLFIPSATGFPMLRFLDLRGNMISRVDPHWFVSMVNLSYLSLSENPISALDANSFSTCQGIEYLGLNDLADLRALDENVFWGLHQLKKLDLCNNKNLTKIHPRAFGSLYQLENLELQNNSLVSLSATTLANLSSLQTISLGDNNWSCDCRTKEFLQTLKLMTNNGLNVTSDFVCLHPESLKNQAALNLETEDLPCEAACKIGSVAILDCPVYDDSSLQILWVTNQLKVYNWTRSLPGDTPTQSPLSGNQNSTDRFSILNNGSLMIRDVARWDAGPYRCISVDQHGNSTAVVVLKLDYTVVSTVFINSLIVGFSTAAGFFAIAVIFGAIRRCCFVCSKKEKVKRKSIREVLSSIRSGSQLEKFSAYRTAKMDQFSAFRSATMDQLSAFTTAKIGKLRTYKQMTVTNVLQHLERMRQHYSLQTARIKDNCSQQVERLRENYAAQKLRLRGQRSQHIRKIRENYNAQTLKIREYRMQQMTKLRDQYKLQQQHLLKLLELLDIGNCVTVIEAECVRTESTIFDADIAFDLEAQSIHIPQDQESHSSNDLSDSESSSLADDRFSISEKDDAGFDMTQLGEMMADDIAMESILADLGDAVPDEIAVETLIAQLSNMSANFATNGDPLPGTSRAEATDGFRMSAVKDSGNDVIHVQIERDASRSTLNADGDAIVETVL